jgi:hypothetical protein
VTLLTIAGLLPAPSATAATEPAPVSSGTLRPVALPSHYVYWNALNDSDQLAGEASSFPSHTIHPVRWDNGVTTTFTTGGPGTGGDALAIDSAGVLFGGIVTEQPRGYPARWSPSGALTTFSAAGGLLDSFNVTVRSASDNGNVLYVPIGTIMNACLGLDIDTGHVHGDDTKYLHVYTAGQLMPNFTFMYFAAMQGKHVVNVDGSTTLNDLIRPGEGRISIGACAQLVIPAGATLAQAFSLLPVHTPGTGEAIGYRRVTITKNGELQTTPASP